LPTVYFRISAQGAHSRTRAPLLERLLARADGPSDAADWRVQAFRAVAPADSRMPAAAAGALAKGASRAAWAALATPVHLLAHMTTIGLAADGILTLEPAEADALVADFNRVFADGGVRLERGRGTELLCRFEEPVRVTTSPPEAAAGRDIWPYLPQGEDAPRLKRLASEIEMWLFDHPVNRRRAAAGSAAINGFWLWGAGAADAEPPPGWIAGDDPLFGFLEPASHYPGAAASGVVMVPDWPGSPAWRDVEERWLGPALEDLRARRLERIELSARRRSMRLEARALRRFWRRARPWWESLLDDD
jgi:hypothetical protein